MSEKKRVLDMIAHENEHLAHEIFYLWADVAVNLIYDEPITDKLAAIDRLQAAINENRAEIERRYTHELN